MMPFVLRRSAPDFTRPTGEKITPIALVGICDGCGYEGAPYGLIKGDVKQAFCGWRDGQPVCVGRGEERTDNARY